MDLSTFSAALFRNGNLLTVAAEIARSADGLVFARQLAGATGVYENQVGTILRDRLARAGLVELVDGHPGGGRRMYYRRIDGPFWKCALQLSEWSEQHGQTAAEVPPEGEHRNR